MSNMTEEEIISTIVMVATQIGPKYVFGYYDREDLIQEGIKYGLEALGRWDQVRPLENFMRVHIRNRLHNLRRNKYCRYEKNADATKSERWAANNKTRQNLMSPLEIKEDVATADDTVDEASYLELVDLIKVKLPAELRTDFLRILDGVSISTIRRVKVKEAIRQIIGGANGS